MIFNIYSLRSVATALAVSNPASASNRLLKIGTLVFIAFLISLSSVLILAPDAFGAYYPIDTTPTISLISPDGTKNVDVSENSDLPWYDVIASANLYTVQGSLGTCSSVRDEMLIKRTTNPIIVTQVIHSAITDLGGANAKAVIISIGVDGTPPPSIGYYDEDTHLYNAGNTAGGLVGLLYVNNSGAYNFRCGLNSSSFSNFSPTQNWYATFIAGRVNGFGNLGFVYYNTFNITYPNSYVGTPFPSSPDTPVPLIFTPKIGYTLFDDMRFQAMSIDKQGLCVPTTSGGCIEPLYRYTLIQGEDIISSTLLKRYEVFKYQYLDEQLDYNLSVTYVHPGTPFAPFSDDVIITPVNFTILGAIGYQSGSNDGINTCEEGDFSSDCGSAPVANLDNCFVEAFPYVDLVSCVQNLQNVAELLSFHTISFKNEWATPDDCHTLTILGDWLYLENKTICPQFPTTIRNITTPFVTFLFGLLTVKFLTRNEGYLQ